MVALITDSQLEESLKAQRAAWGADKWDEVWEGTYILAPLPNNEHQEIAGKLTVIIAQTIDMTGLGRVFPGVNVSDRQNDWQSNYRCPDVVVFLNDTKAKNCDTFWLGGPDFAVEVVSPGDQTRKKLPFYDKVGTRELLIVDRDPWRLELFRLTGDKLASVAASDTATPAAIQSNVIPFTFALVPGEKRPRINVTHRESRQTWAI